jgi:hypothetical protein
MKIFGTTLAAAAAATLGVALLTGAAPAVQTDAASAKLECYRTARDATYNTDCYSVRHWVKRSSTGSTKHYGDWVGHWGTSMVISWNDWKSSGTETR